MRAAGLHFCLLGLAALGLEACGAGAFGPELSAQSSEAQTRAALSAVMPNWQPGDRWIYSDGYGLEVVSRDGEKTVFQRTDDPAQWFSRTGFLRDQSLSRSTLRQTMFQTAVPESGIAVRYGEPLTYRREFRSGDKVLSHSTSWTVEGRERITVPVGTYDCLVLVWRTRSLDSDWTGFERWWFAPEIGHYVRLEYRYGEMPTRSRVLTVYRFGTAGSAREVPGGLAAMASGSKKAVAAEPSGITAAFMPGRMKAVP